MKASFSMFGTTAPTAMKRRLDKARAAPLATKPNSSAAFITASCLSARTRAVPFRTLDTVAVETPARSATSFVTGKRAGSWMMAGFVTPSDFLGSGCATDHMSVS
ncbi:hypothetical protein MGN01_20570 [Methylobacterium gnaphalii]|uniref:Uncharacterized protein n=1 Tax=Methylobacterium gnaphalii TaxID=1010610 RepID=A0A512JK27_9HYPH|nr:hypothetical protein MGN01_20570 [Methylobacterium gnaphalii]GLS48729.1 hypothetical protein GCM10007885_15730 [Methylobacterium gnaphalii]